MSLVLGADVGATNARFALADAGTKRIVRTEVLEAAAYARFEDALASFLDASRSKIGRARVLAASIGIAGPVVDGRVRTTNLPWTVDARALSRAFPIGEVTLMNDLVATGLGAMTLAPSKLAILKGTRPKRSGANVAVIAAGTGLGEAAFVWDGRGHVPCATEGAHVDFAPRTEEERELEAELAREHGHVSYEHVASASSIGRLYAFFADRLGRREPKALRAKIASAPDANAAVVGLALDGASPAARRALDTWASVYGAEAGNLALKSLATGGVYVAGGVSAKLAAVLARGLPGDRGPSPFLRAFTDKGRMRALLEGISVAVVLEPRSALLGAVGHAASVVAASHGARVR